MVFMRIENNKKIYKEKQLTAINEEKILSKSNLIVKRKKYKSCPLCNSKDIYEYKRFDCTSHPLYKDNLEKNIIWMNCKKCNHQFTEGYFSDKDLDLILSDTPDVQTVGFKIEKHREFSAKIIEKVLPYQQEGYWLDLGFGNGSLLFTAQEFGFHPVGIDLRKDNVKTMKNLGFEVYCEHLNNLNFLTDFSVISAMDILEHIPFPKQTLKTLSNLLKKNGCMLISMPNSESIVWRLLDASNNNFYMKEIEHYHNFSRTILYKLLEQCGMKPVRYSISERYRACMEVLAIKN